jgi:hypothetical protein
MTIDVTCGCGHTLHAPDSAAGRGLRCPACQRPVLVPVAVPGSAYYAGEVETLPDGVMAPPAWSGAVTAPGPAPAAPWIEGAEPRAYGVLGLFAGMSRALAILSLVGGLGASLVAVALGPVAHRFPAGSSLAWAGLCAGAGVVAWGILSASSAAAAVLLDAARNLRALRATSAHR